AKARLAALHHAGVAVALIAAAAVAALGVSVGWTWRATVMVAAVLTLAGAAARAAVTDPPIAADERQREQLARVLRIGVVRRALAAYAVLGMATVPLFLYLVSRLEQRGVPTHRATTIAALAWLPAIVSVAIAGRRVEQWLAARPLDALRLAATA